MFYSESLLSKTGPLARVWLASNLDRKLTKQNVLASKLEDNVKDIIGGGQAPMALRLSSQLLLGVCKIYNRKATYLMDDCSEALLKIKMAFRPGNVDLPSNQSHKANPNALLLPDTITELDLFAPLPDPDDFLAGNDSRAPGQDPTLLDFGMSQILDSQTPTKRSEKRLLQLHDDDLGLDMGFDDDLVRSPRMSEGPSIEIGRRAQSVRPDQPSLLEDDLGLDIDVGLDDDTMGPDTTLRPSSAGGLLADDDVAMGGMDDEIAAANAAALARADAAKRLPRDSESPLSSARSSVAPVLEGDSFRPETTLAMEDEEDPTLVQAAQRVKRRKVMTMDTETELQVHELRQQQEDRSAITKAPTYLPRDPLLLQLLEMQRSGTFVSNILGDGYLAGMAPELRGILSLEIIRKAGNKKRKRDSGVADVGSDAEEEAELDDAPQLDIPADDDFDGAPTPAPHFSDGFGLEDDNLAAGAEESYTAHFDITEAPLLHPSQSGPVALGTKKMVHLLRDRFGSSSSNSAASPSTRTGNVALFTELCPERTTDAATATAAFFELLVLGTKDAIKVEQDNRKTLGGPLRVRAKRGLWGDWAEMTGAAAAANAEESAEPAQTRAQESAEEQRDFAPAASAMVEVGA